MLNISYIQKLREEFHSYAEIRREIIKQAGDALHHSKRAIFSMHRDEMKDAEEKLHSSATILKMLLEKYNKKLMPAGLANEPTFKAALEEHVEAVLFHQFLTEKKIGKLNLGVITAEIYMAGLCDLIGELYRYSVKSATRNDTQMVHLCSEAAHTIYGELIEFDFTKYLRTKADQAKGAVHKIEIIQYELSLRNK